MIFEILEKMRGGALSHRKSARVAAPRRGIGTPIAHRDRIALSWSRVLIHWAR